MKVPAWIFATSLPGTGGREGERSMAGAEVVATAVDGTGDPRSSVMRLPSAEMDPERVVAVDSVSAATEESREGGGSDPKDPAGRQSKKKEFVAA